MYLRVPVLENRHKRFSINRHFIEEKKGFFLSPYCDSFEVGASTKFEGRFL